MFIFGDRFDFLEHSRSFNLSNLPGTINDVLIMDQSILNYAEKCLAVFPIPDRPVKITVPVCLSPNI